MSTMLFLKYIIMEILRRLTKELSKFGYLLKNEQGSIG